MRDDRRPRFPVLDAAWGHLRVTAPWAVWLILVICFVVARDEKVGAIPIYVAAVLLGSYRAVVFHPQWDVPYREWLAQTPWTPAHPLPRGPIHLVWPDGLVVGALALAAAISAIPAPLWIVNLYIFAYCLAIALLTLSTRTLGPAYLTLFSLGLMARLWLAPWTCGIVGVISYLAVYWGIRRSLKSFPWVGPTDADAPPPILIPELISDRERRGKLGWPYDRLMVQPARSPDHRRFSTHWLIVCALAAWWLSVISASGIDPVGYLWVMRVFGYALVVIGVIMRLTIYRPGYASPISPLGRISARRLIVPGYDAAFLAYPLLLLVPETVVGIGKALGLSPMVYAPIIPASVLFMALATPPGLRQWRLTGRHRMVAALSARDKNYVKVG